MRLKLASFLFLVFLIYRTYLSKPYISAPIVAILLTVTSIAAAIIPNNQYFIFPPN